MSPDHSGKQPKRGRTRQILGINFFTDDLDLATEQAVQGGLVLAPSGPGLAVDLVKSQSYRDAVTAADLVLVDSSALVLFWRMFSGEALKRISGLMFLRAVLLRPELKKEGAVFWVMPSQEEARRNFEWLGKQGFRNSPEDCYIAPHYGGAVGDDELLRRIETRKPRIVVLAIGGGVQEQLGHFLARRLSYRPGIFCTGAAIAFLSGGQANIPAWIDTIMLAWLWRILYSPRRYAGRYWQAWGLFPILWRNREKMPPLRG